MGLFRALTSRAVDALDRAGLEAMIDQALSPVLDRGLAAETHRRVAQILFLKAEDASARAAAADQIETADSLRYVKKH